MFFNPYRRRVGLLLAFLMSGGFVVFGFRCVWGSGVSGGIGGEEEMILDLIQTRKELFTAEFKILRGGVNVGNIFLKGTLGSMEANIIVNLFGVTYELHRDTWQVSPDPKMIKYYRPYKVSILPKTKQLGVVTYVERKIGWFKTRTYLSFTSGSDVYNGYALGMGREGFKTPIYLKDKLIAEIDSDNVINNERHKYIVYCKKNEYSVPAVLMTVYSYIIGGFNPGEKVYKSKRIVYSKTTDKFLVSKYDSEFTKEIRV